MDTKLKLGDLAIQHLLDKQVKKENDSLTRENQKLKTSLAEAIKKVGILKEEVRIQKSFVRYWKKDSNRCAKLHSDVDWIVNIAKRITKTHTKKQSKKK